MEMKRYFTSKVEEVSRVMIIYKGNEYHEWMVRDIVKKKGLRIERKAYTERSLKKLRYSGLFDEASLVWIEVDEVKKMKEYLEAISLGKKYIVFEITKPVQEKLLTKLKIDGHTPKALPKVDDWDGKMRHCTIMVDNIGVKFDKDLTRKTLIQTMMANTDEWKDIELSLLVAKESKTTVDMDYLDKLFPNLEFYKLDDFIQMVIEGKKKKKTIYIADYFLRVKGYSPVWLMQKIRERALELGGVYEAYKKGVIYKTLDSSSKIVERSKTVGWGYGEETIAEMKAKDMVWSLYTIQKVPYKHYVKVMSILFDGKEYVQTKEELYGYIESIREAREGLGEPNEYIKRKHKRK